MSKSTNSLYKESDILIVENDMDFALSIELTLKKMNYNVSGIETNPKDAIVHARNKRPDIILIDINLKNSSISGIDAACQIWRDMKIPIVFLTSYSDDKTIKKALECEPYGYLIKPCKDIELKATINIALHKHKYFFENKDNIIQKQNHFIYINNSFKFDNSSSILYKDEEQISLTRNEKKLFEIICNNPNEITSFNTISSYIWREPIYDMGKLRTLVYRLRVKLGINPFENIYEEGYKINTIKKLA
ncbi:MAG: response regulator [Poseidonibacter sp.]|uniref:response regulator n=1 Tax=Poseidonibacter sp. TaxID=2321188 RepID=UPI00359E17D7